VRKLVGGSHAAGGSDLRSYLIGIAGYLVVELARKQPRSVTLRRLKEADREDGLATHETPETIIVQPRVIGLSLPWASRAIAMTTCSGYLLTIASE